MVVVGKDEFQLQLVDTAGQVMLGVGRGAWGGGGKGAAAPGAAPGTSPALPQDEYTILPHSFVIGIHGYVLVYSVTSLRR